MSESKRALRGLLLVCLGGLAACGHAGLPVADYPETAPVARPESKAPAPVQVLLSRTEYRLEPDGGFTRTMRRRYKVLTDQGAASWTETGASWSPWYMARPVVSATVTSAAGEESKLDPSTLAETAASPEGPDVYGDTRVLRGPLPNVKAGSTVDEVIVTRTTKPFFGAGGYAHHVIFQSAVAHDKVELEIDLPEGTPLRYELRNAQATVEDTRSGGRRHLSFHGGPYSALQAIEPLAPSDVPEWPHVAFTTGTGWQPIVAEYARIVDAKLSGPDLAGVVAKIVEPSDSPKVKADKFLGWMRKRVRYAGIEFGDSAVTPQPPGETLKRGYGDCKDQATLLVGLLRASGVPGRIALLNAGYDEDVRKELPALNAFNHAIVVIPGDPPIWIDPTAAHTRAGELPGPDEGRLALVIDAGTKELTRTPAMEAKQNTYLEVRTVHLPELGKARIVEESTATGHIERGLRANFVEAKDSLKEGLGAYVAKAYNTESLGAFEVSPSEELATPLKVRVEAKETRVAITNLVTADAIIDADPIFGWVPNALAEGESRTTELALPAPYDAELRYEVHPPEGFLPGELPALKDVVLGPATLARAIEVRRDGVVALRYHFTLPKRRWSSAEVTAFRTAYAAVRAEPHPTVSFVHEGQKHHLERHPDLELEAYRRQVKAHPRGAVPKMRLAIALEDLGFGGSARALADEAVKLQPEDATLLRFLGDICTRDVFGRSFHVGYDRAAALAAYRAAAQRTPDDMYVQTQIAVLLEHDAAGVRYADPAQLVEAVAQYDKLDPEKLRAYANGSHASNALFALMWGGRFDELRARLGKLERKRVPEVVAIVAAAEHGGPNAGLAEAARLKLPQESRSQVLDGAAGTLIRLRRYPEAAALSDAASSGSSDPALRVRARAQKRLQKLDPATMPVGKPEELVAKAFALFTSQPKVTDAQARAYISARAYDRKGNAATLEVLRDTTHASDALALTPTVLADVVVAGLEIVPEGSPAVGFRVKVSSEAAAMKSYQMFVVREAGGYRIRAFSSTPAELGCEALHLAKAGEKKPAAQWLDWAHELVGSSGGQDPLRELPFSRLWVGGAGNVELAAAALCAAGRQGEQAAPTLEAARARATAEQQIILDHALAMAYSGADQPRELLATVNRLEAAVPTSEVARMITLAALWETGDYAAIRAKVTAHLAKGPDDRLLGMLAEVETVLGHYAESLRAGERLIASGNAGPGTYNNQAWHSVFAGTVTDKELGYALRAVTAEPDGVPGLNTLAALHAEIGHTEDARETLVKVLALRPGGAPHASDWYVIGRIAEQLSLPDEARAAYAHITKPEKPRGGTEYELAQKRLKGLR
jgi:tetratricopeptide (TPR) repeat protein